MKETLCGWRGLNFCYTGVCRLSVVCLSSVCRLCLSCVVCLSVTYWYRFGTAQCSGLKLFQMVGQDVGSYGAKRRTGHIFR